MCCLFEIQKIYTALESHIAATAESIPLEYVSTRVWYVETLCQEIKMLIIIMQNGLNFVSLNLKNISTVIFKPEILQWCEL